MMPRIKQMEVKKDDIYILSFPKCGTTLTMELAWLISHQADVRTASSTRGSRCAFLEGPSIVGSENWEEYYTNCETLPSPR